MRATVVALGVAWLLSSGSLLSGCPGGGSGEGGATTPVSDDVVLTPAFGGVAFARPVKLVQHPSEDDRWYVVEQAGLIRTFLGGDVAGTLQTALDLSGVNFGDTTREQGLLSMVFDPDFATSGEIYLTYTDETAQSSVLARYTSSDDGLSFVAPAEPVVLEIAHPRDNHNAGDLAFGPDDGLLYYSMGDGGGIGDPDENAQDPTTLLGNILRIDVVSMPAPAESYVAPAGNLFAGNALCDGGAGSDPCPEIYAYGLRNPWRMSFDMDTGELWTGDVGQSTLEEIDRIVADGNYGWDCLEGDVVFENDASCNGVGFEPPEVVHDRTEANSITGGVVYRGGAIPALDGYYVYADFIKGLFWAFDTNDPFAAPERLDLPPLPVAAFGQDRAGEVYVVTFADPSIYRLDPTPPP